MNGTETTPSKEITDMRNRRTGFRILATLLITFTAGLWPGWLAGQPLTEGYDPMRQITAQLVKANLLIVQDVSGSMAWDRWGNGIGDSGPGTEELSIQDQSATGRLIWSETEAPSNDTARGTVRFGQIRVSNGANRTREFADVRGVSQPGIYTYDFTGQPFTYTDTTSGNTVYPTSLPALTYNGGKYYLVYKCKPTGSWSAVGKVPWDASKDFYANNAWDTSSCAGPFTWTLRFDLPSRMSNVKNALGNSVYLAETYTPPTPTDPARLVTRWPVNATWAEPWRSAVVDAKTSAAGPWLKSYTEGNANWVSNPHWYAFRVETGWDLVNPAAVYNPTGATPVNPASKANYVDPGRPFVAYYYAGDSDLPVLNDTSGKPLAAPGTIVVTPASRASELAPKIWAIGQPRPGFGSSELSAPRSIILGNRDRINFGLQVYSGQTDSFPFHVPIDTTDGTNVTRLLSFLAPRRTPASTADLSFTAPKRIVPVEPTNTESVTPLGASGNTPTKYALEQAAEELQSTFYGTTAKPLSTSNDPVGGWKLPADPKKACKRPYGVVLVTDGLSNHGNPRNWSQSGTGADRNWIDPCAATIPANTCDVGTSGYDCPENWKEFAAGIADQIYNTALDPGSPYPKVNPRVWSIGISPVVGPCELNFIAYMGRTDGSSPSGDAGFGGYDATSNPFLPNPAATVDDYPIDGKAGTYDGPTGQYKYSKDTSKDYDPAPGGAVGHGNNAFFATDAQAIRDAFVSIVNATATGDYATNAPVSGMSAKASEMVYLPSTIFPTWQGRLYAFDTTKAQFLDPPDNKVPNPVYTRWEAGATLNSRSSDDRKIFTWDPANKALVEVTAANLAVAPLKDVPGMTAQVVDFIRGNDGAGTPRTWRLGPMINSAPAIVAAPGSWTQNSVSDHTGFQTTYGGRDPLIWVGANDGMMHAFRAKVDDPDADPPQPGLVEQIAIIPPNLLWKQVTLYNNFVEDPDFPSGQTPDILEHVYGVANSFRFGDVYDKTEAKYRTIGIVTLGAGGSDVVAMDVSSIPRPDASAYPASPVTILWTKTAGASSTATTLAGLQETWSIPAMAPVNSDTWRLVVGSGFNPTNTAANQVANTNFLAPRTYVLDPVTGNLLQTNTLSSLSSPVPFVGNQAFADSVLFDPKAKTYQDDNLARVGLQADLNGRIWFLWENSEGSGSFDKTQVGIDVSSDVTPSQSQPLYYNPAASGYGVPATGCVAYAFGSGALYERSSAVTGSSIGTSPSFIPRIYVATHGKTLWKTGNPKVPAANIKSKVISSAWTVVNADNTTKTVIFGNRTQMTAPAFALVPRSGSGDVIALFLLYDPDNGCNGFSYVAKVEFKGGGDTCVPGEPKYTAYEAGVGAASGFTIAGDKVLVSKSGIGQGQRASLYEPPNISASVGSTNKPKVKWWKELK